MIIERKIETALKLEKIETTSIKEFEILKNTIQKLYIEKRHD